MLVKKTLKTTIHDVGRLYVAHFVYDAKIRNEFYSATKQIKI